MAPEASGTWVRTKLPRLVSTGCVTGPLARSAAE